MRSSGSSPTSSNAAGAATSPTWTATRSGRSRSKDSTRTWSGYANRSSRWRTGGWGRAARRSSTIRRRPPESCSPGSTSATDPPPSWRRAPTGRVSLQHGETGRRSHAGSTWQPGFFTRRVRSPRFASLRSRGPGTVALRAQANPAVAVARRRRRAHEPVAMAVRRPPTWPRPRTPWCLRPRRACGACGPRCRGEGRVRRAAARASGALGDALGGGGRRRRGGSGAATCDSAGPLSPDGVGRGHGRGGSRCARP